MRRTMTTKLSFPTKKCTSYFIEVLIVEIKGELYTFLLQIKLVLQICWTLLQYK